MKNLTLKNILFKAMVSCGFVLILLVGYLLNPAISYAHQTDIEGLRIYHEAALDPTLSPLITESLTTLRASEIYDPNIQIDFCLNDGAFYPKVVKAVLGPDIIRAFSNKCVVIADPVPGKAFFSWRGNQFSYTQALSHVLTHNLQFNYHGFWQANPLGGHPEWKWEGYAEYVSLGKKYTLSEIWKAYQQSGEEMYDFVHLKNGEGTLKLHVRFLLLTKFCLEEKGLSYARFMEEDLEEERVWAEIQSVQKEL